MRGFWNCQKPVSRCSSPYMYDEFPTRISPKSAGCRREPSTFKIVIIKKLGNLHRQLGMLEDSYLLLGRRENATSISITPLLMQRPTLSINLNFNFSFRASPTRDLVGVLEQGFSVLDQGQNNYSAHRWALRRTPIKTEIRICKGQ